jgi:hypothetical protein
MKFMLLVEYEPDKPTIPEVFGIEPKTLATFFEKVVERWNKPVENDRQTDVFFDALNEIPEEKKAGVIMSMAVVQMVEQMKMMSMMEGMKHGLGEMLRKALEDHEKHKEGQD